MIDKVPTIDELAEAQFVKRIKTTRLGADIARLKRVASPILFELVMAVAVSAYRDGFHDGIEYHEVHRT